MSKQINNSRKQQLEELKSFTEAVQKEIVDIVGILGWTLESITDTDQEYLVCPYDSSHRLTEESLNDHVLSCQWKAEGYGTSDVPLSEPTLPEDSPFSIKFSQQLQAEILRKASEENPTMAIGTGERLVPRTSDRLVTDFTSDEKKALYDYVIAHTKKLDIGRDIVDINDLKPQERMDKELSATELLMQERNLKRRRARHRGVHTNKKSHTEILREVINQQMEIYVDHISGQSDSIDASVKKESDHESAQDRGTERLYKIFRSSSQNYDDSRERNGYSHHSRRNDLKRDKSSEERSYHRSRERDKRNKYSDECSESAYRKREHNAHRKSSRDRSRDRKSHRKSKHRSKDKHKDKHRERKHKSGDRDRSSERHSKHNDHKRRKRDKEY